MRIDPLRQHLQHLAVRNLRPSTLHARREHIRRFAHSLGTEPDDTLLAVTGDDLLRWQVSMLALSANYRSNATSHIRAFYRWCAVAGLVDRDPAVALAAVRTPRSLPRPIGEDDLYVAITCAPERLRCMLVLAAFEGLRACEIAGLMRHQVLDTADPPVLLVVGKGGRERIVPLSGRSLMELRGHGLPSRGFVFPRHDGQPGGNTAQRISAMCNEYLHGLGISDTLHALRHRFGTKLYAASSDLRMTQEVMGHSSPATTSGYVAWSSQAAVDAVERIPSEQGAEARTVTA